MFAQIPQDVLIDIILPWRREIMFREMIDRTVFTYIDEELDAKKNTYLTLPGMLNLTKQKIYDDKTFMYLSAYTTRGKTSMIHRSLKTPHKYMMRAREQQINSKLASMRLLTTKLAGLTFAEAFAITCEVPDKDNHVYEHMFPIGREFRHGMPLLTIDHESFCGMMLVCNETYNRIWNEFERTNLVLFYAYCNGIYKDGRDGYIDATMRHMFDSVHSYTGKRVEDYSCEAFDLKKFSHARGDLSPMAGLAMEEILNDETKHRILLTDYGFKI